MFPKMKSNADFWLNDPGFDWLLSQDTQHQKCSNGNNKDGNVGNSYIVSLVETLFTVVPQEKKKGFKNKKDLLAAHRLSKIKLFCNAIPDGKITFEDINLNEEEKNFKRLYQKAAAYSAILRYWEGYGRAYYRNRNNNDLQFVQTVESQIASLKKEIIKEGRKYGWILKCLDEKSTEIVFIKYEGRVVAQDWLAWIIGFIVLNIFTALCSGAIALAMLPTANAMMPVLPIILIALIGVVSTMTNIILGKDATVNLMEKVFMYPKVYARVVWTERKWGWKGALIFSILSSMVMASVLFVTYYSSMMLALPMLGAWMGFSLGGALIPICIVLGVSGALTTFSFSFYGFTTTLERFRKFIWGKSDTINNDQIDQNTKIQKSNVIYRKICWVLGFIAAIIVSIAALYGTVISGHIFGITSAIGGGVLLATAVLAFSGFYIEIMAKIIQNIGYLIYDSLVFLGCKLGFVTDKKYASSVDRIVSIWEYFSWKHASVLLFTTLGILLNAFGFAALGASIFFVSFGITGSLFVNRDAMKDAGVSQLNDDCKFKDVLVQVGADCIQSKNSPPADHPFDHKERMRDLAQRSSNHAEKFLNKELVNSVHLKRVNPSKSDGLQQTMKFSHLQQCSLVIGKNKAKDHLLLAAK